MVNSEKFAKRLQEVIDYYGMTASSFADAIAFNRSSISHLLSGRNKPSLEFVMKVLGNFPEVKLYWLLNGDGNFPETEADILKEKKSEKFQQATTPSLFDNEKPEKSNIQNKEAVNFPKTSDTASIEKIVIFYRNGTFKIYEN